MAGPSFDVNHDPVNRELEISTDDLVISLFEPLGKPGKLRINVVIKDTVQGADAHDIVEINVDGADYTFHD
jgi:hypothetical protein